MRFPVKKPLYLLVLLKKSKMIRSSTLHLTFLILALVIISCKNSDESSAVPKNTTYESKKAKLPLELNQFEHQVSGTDENGNNIHGIINIEGKIGIGTLIAKDAKEIEVVVEWIDEHELLGTDAHGYEYNLKIK
jgi:hypothetical protein